MVGQPGQQLIDLTGGLDRAVSDRNKLVLNGALGRRADGDCLLDQCAVGVKTPIVDDLVEAPQALLCVDQRWQPLKQLALGLNVLFAVVVERSQTLRIVEPIGAGWVFAAARSAR